jgi:hypothetical protein
VLAGPLIWLAALEWNYVATYVACETGRTWYFHIAEATGVLLTGAAGLAAWRRGPPQDTAETSAPVTRSTTEIRARWMALLGVSMSVWFIVLILAMEIPIVVLRACR